MKEHIFSEMVQDYLKGNLSMVEMERFEQSMLADPDLQKEVALQRAEMAAAEGIIADEARQWFKEWEDNNALTAPVKSRNTSIYWIAIAMGLCLLSVVVYWYLRAHINTPPAFSAPVQQPVTSVPTPGNTLPQMPENKPTQALETAPNTSQPKPVQGPTEYASLARQYFKEPVLSNFRSGANPAQNSALEQAKMAYANAQYHKAISLLVDPDQAQQQSADFLSGCALFHLKHYDAAANKFLLLIAADSRQYRMQSEWSLLLCQYAQYPKYQKETEQKLEAILADPNHPYQEEAKKLKMRK